MRRLPWIIFVLIGFLGAPQGSLGDDTDVLFQCGPRTDANVLIIFDNSSSMSQKVPYDDGFDYSTYASNKQTCCGQRFETNKIYYQTSHCCCNYGPQLPSCNENGCTSGSQGGCAMWRYDERLPTHRVFVDSNKDGEDDGNSGSSLKLFRGNYLNYLFFYTETRFEAAKAALENLLDTYGSQLNFGLMTFRKDTMTTCPYKIDGYYVYRSDGAELLEPVAPNNAAKIKKWFENPTVNNKSQDMRWRVRPGGMIPYLGGQIERCDAYPSDPFGSDSVATVKSLLKGDVMFTPLAEALTHAGMYFEGGWKGHAYHWSTGYKDPESGCYDYANVSLSYIRSTCKALPFDRPLIGGGVDMIGPSPITSNTQKNYVILFTDGNPANDGSVKILGKYLDSFPVSDWFMDRDYDKAREESNPQRQTLLINVVEKLYNRDLRPDLPSIPGELGGGKNLTTYIVGFGVGNDFLRAAAAKSNTTFQQAGNAEALKEAFLKVAGEMIEASIITPTASIPSDGMVSGNHMYVPYAMPVANGLWSGDLKKFVITRDQLVAGANIIETAVPLWSVETKLKERLASGTDNRNIYTYLVPPKPLTSQQNAFNLTNSEENGGNINKARLDIVGTSLSASDIIRFVRGFNYDSVNKRLIPRKNPLGDVLHSVPIAVKYSTGTVIYFGANDGMLHAIDEATGTERWAFIPPVFLPRLKELYTNMNHPYFVDGSPKVAELNSKGLVASEKDKVARRILVFGLRKGGSAYYALDITNPDTPEFLWEITPSSSGFAELAETWSEPVFGNMKVNGASTPVAFFGAGYSSANIKGRGVYAVNLLTGARVWSRTNADLKTTMIYSIPSTVLPFDIEEDGIIDRLYVGDLGGQVWVFNLSPRSANDWTSRLLFKPGVSGLKIFYPPDLVKEKDANYLYFGTGDRENPMDASVTDRLYCVKDRDLPADKFATISENNLVSLTNNELQESTDEKKKGEIRAQLNERDGWYILLENPGEKCLAPATVFLKIAYFSTFSPFLASGAKACDARVYALSYTDAMAVFNWDKQNDTKSPGTGTWKGKADRVVKLSGKGIPSEVLVTIMTPQKDPTGRIPAGNAGGLVVPLVASGGGISVPAESPMMNALIPYSWRADSP